MKILRPSDLFLTEMYLESHFRETERDRIGPQENYLMTVLCDREDMTLKFVFFNFSNVWKTVKMGQAFFLSHVLPIIEAFVMKARYTAELI